MKASYAFVILASITILFILSSNTNVSANEQIVACRGETLQISARLLMNGTYGDPVANQIIEFYDETNDVYIGSALTELDGYASIEWYLPLNYSLGPTIVNATFRGNDTYALYPSYQQVTTIIQASTNLDIDVKKSNFVPGDQLIFTILLTNDNANCLSNESVDVFCGPIFLISGKTNATGHARFVISCNQSWGNLGLNNITIFYEGNSQKFYASSENFFLITINRIETHIEVNHQIPLYLGLNDFLNLNLSLKANNTPLENSTIEVILDNEHFTNLMTNENGLAMFSLVIDNNFILGPHRFKFDYFGSERYEISFFIVDFIVTSPVITKVESLTNCIIGESSIVRVHLYDLLKRPILNTSILLIDSITNETFLQKLNSNITYSDFQLQFDEPRGKRDYTLEIVGNEYITNKSRLFTLSIWTRPIITIINSSITSYASPGQVITLGVRLYDYSRNYSNRLIRFISNDKLINTTSSTNNFGIIIVDLMVSMHEGKYELSITFEGNKTEYELSMSILYVFYVIRVMPIKVNLQEYYVIPSLQHLQLNLIVTALNGSALEGIELNYNWYNVKGYAISSQDGFINLYLSVPSEEGLYSFVYQTMPSNLVQSCSGSIVIEINERDAASSQGVGIVGLVSSIGLSLGIIIMPRIIRKRMIGL